MAKFSIFMTTAFDVQNPKSAPGETTSLGKFLIFVTTTFDLQNPKSSPAETTSLANFYIGNNKIPTKMFQYFNKLMLQRK